LIIKGGGRQNQSEKRMFIELVSKSQVPKKSKKKGAPEREGENR